MTFLFGTTRDPVLLLWVCCYQILAGNCKNSCSCATLPLVHTTPRCLSVVGGGREPPPAHINHHFPSHSPIIIDISPLPVPHVFALAISTPTTDHLATPARPHPRPQAPRPIALKTRKREREHSTSFRFGAHPPTKRPETPPAWPSLCAPRSLAPPLRSPAGTTSSTTTRPRGTDCGETETRGPEEKQTSSLRLTRPSHRYSDLQPVGMGAFGLVW